MLALDVLPPFALSRGLYEFSSYAFMGISQDLPGLSWANLQDEHNGLIRVWVIMAAGKHLSHHEIF